MCLKYEEIYSYTDSNGIIDQIWLIGNDLGDLHYFTDKVKKALDFIWQKIVQYILKMLIRLPIH